MLSFDSEQGVFLVSRPGTATDQLPGIMESVEVGGSVKMEDVPLEEGSGSKKVVAGWNDADVSIKLSLIDNPGKKKTRFDYLEVIVGIFKKLDKAGFPEVININHPFVNAWGVKKLIFRDLKTSESRGRKKISVSLEFVEYDIVVGLAQDRIVALASATEKTEAETQQASSVSAADARRLAAMERKLGYI